MNPRAPIDVTNPAERRRFYLQRAFRKNTRGAGSDLAFLMSLPRSKGFETIATLFGAPPC